jgi:hypothetical protein
MGFTKRFISKELIVSTRKEGMKVSALFNCDSIICTDEFSFKILNLYIQGKSEEELKSEVLHIIHLE